MMNFLIFAESLHLDEHAPIGLQNLGYEPIVIIMIESIRYFYTENPIYVVLSHNVEDKRWFKELKDVHLVTGIKDASSLPRFMKEKSISQLCTLDCRYPLISKFTIKEFITESKDSSSQLVSSKAPISGFYIIRMDSFQGFDNLKTHTMKDKKEASRIDTRDDLLYVEHQYMESKHVIFLQQCYELWKKSMLLEERIAHLESILK